MLFCSKTSRSCIMFWSPHLLCGSLQCVLWGCVFFFYISCLPWSAATAALRLATSIWLQSSGSEEMESWAEFVSSIFFSSSFFLWSAAALIKFEPQSQRDPKQTNWGERSTLSSCCGFADWNIIWIHSRNALCGVWSCLAGTDWDKSNIRRGKKEKKCANLKRNNWFQLCPQPFTCSLWLFLWQCEPVVLYHNIPSSWRTPIPLKKWKLLTSCDPTCVCKSLKFVSKWRNSLFFCRTRLRKKEGQTHWWGAMRRWGREKTGVKHAKVDGHPLRFLHKVQKDSSHKGSHQFRINWWEQI